MIAVRNYCATHGEPSHTPPPQSRRGATHGTDGYRWIRMEQIIRKIPQNARLKGLSEITVPSVSICIHPHSRPPEDGKGAKFAPFSGNHATSKYVASLHGVSDRTVRNAAEAAEAVDGTPTRPLAGSSCWRCSMHKGDNLSPLSESDSSCYGATGPPPLAPNRPWRKIFAMVGVSCDLRQAKTRSN